MSGEEMLALQEIVRRVPISDFCLDYVMSIVRSTRAAEPQAPKFIKDWVIWGVGPRGGQSLILAAKARAALDGRPEVDLEDIRAMAKPVLRHRMVLNYHAEAQGQSPDTVIQQLLDSTPTHGSTAGSNSHGRVERVLKA
jgi:MoxR-like ATPase